MSRNFSATAAATISPREKWGLPGWREAGQSLWMRLERLIQLNRRFEPI
jgi:hypothetical protein